MTTESVPPPPDFSKESLNGIPVEAAPGVWVAGEMHTPGGVKNFPMNNRSFIFRVTLKKDLAGAKKGQEVLFVMGLGKKPILAGVQKLVEDTGLPLVALLANGGDHHVSIKFWYDAFPKMKVWVCPTRVPTTLNGKFLMKEYPDRWELVDNTTVPNHVYQLIEYFGDQVDCVLFNQLYVYSDAASEKAGGWCHCHDEPKEWPSYTAFTKLVGEQFMDFSSPLDETVLYHKATKLIITGHHVEFVYCPKGYVTPDYLKASGWGWKILMSMMISPGRYVTGIAAGVDQRIRDPAIHAQQWQEVLKYDFLYSCGHHDMPGVCGPLDQDDIMKGEGGLKGYFTRMLTASGELTGEADPGSWWPYRSANAICKCVQNEPKFLAKYGELPVLRCGGPGYNAEGFKDE